MLPRRSNRLSGSPDSRSFLLHTNRKGSVMSVKRGPERASPSFTLGVCECAINVHHPLRISVYSSDVSYENQYKCNFLRYEK
jgi:hypothetical protein